MLEIKNLVKIYKTKNGAEVRALDGISAALPQKGMVFLLGKSGSGKSTLLNVCGGLDTPDSGEIIIKGRSSKDFTQSDFDSYRNTFVGFVFQEYNILNEFSVEDNVALALELQGKGKDKAQIKAILEQVDLEDFAKRKPNTLSGGQKQRVAIARALVKNPEIIMADEPTGALDSATGRQVLDTLKKLSAQKLVIVVSHDREFASLYGDRIIELKDGKIISDVTKERVDAVAHSDNLSFIGDDTIAIKSGAALTDGDVEEINKFLRSSDKDLIISCGEREIKSFKRAASIDENGAMGRFRATVPGDAAAAGYTEKDRRFIRSRLPMRHAARIGASSLKVKPIRLLFTIFLSVIAFTMFGLLSTLTFYDPVETAVNTYPDSDYSSLLLKNNYRYTQIQYQSGEEVHRRERSENTNFTPDDLDKLKSEYGNKALGVFDGSDPAKPAADYGIKNVGNLNSAYYNASLDGFAVFEPQAWQGDMLTQTDLSALTDDQIVISSFTFDGIKQAGLQIDGSMVQLNDYRDIVGLTLSLYSEMSGTQFEAEVAGVYRYELPQKYDALMQNSFDRELAYEFEYELNGGCRVALVSDGFYGAHMVNRSVNLYFGFEFLSEQSVYMKTQSDIEDGGYSYQVYDINSLPTAQGDAPVEIAFFDGRAQAALADGEIAVPFGNIYDYVWSMAQDKVLKMHELAKAEGLSDAEQAALTAEAQAFEARIYDYIGILANAYRTDYSDPYSGGVSVEATDEEITVALDNVLELIAEYADSDLAQFEHTYYLSESTVPYRTFNVVGFYYGKMSGKANGVYLSVNEYNELYAIAGDPAEWTTENLTKYVKPEDAIYCAIIIPIPESAAGLRALFTAENAVAEDDTFFTVENMLSDSLNSANSLIKQLEQIFLWIGVVMAVFAMLLLFNFISVSITHKKKDIGILRAVGARSQDVFKIFYSESAFITAICYGLAIIACFAVCYVLNKNIVGVIGVNLFVFGPLSWLVMLGIAVATSLVATFLPVYGIAKRKPVESIRAL